MQLRNYIIGIVLGVVFIGCANRPSYYKPIQPELNVTEAFKYDKKYKKEYQEIIKPQIEQYKKENEIIRWIQASNKKVPCKIFVGTTKNNDRTQDPEYRIFWDGKCKNGYAYGLGREFEKGTLIDSETIAIYSGKKEEPKYYIQKNKLTNSITEGDLNNGCMVNIDIKDDGLNFNIYYVNACGSTSSLNLITVYSPFSDIMTYTYGYPNFNYTFWDFSKNEFDSRQWQVEMRNKDNSGYVIVIYKNGYKEAFEVKNNQKIKTVKLPESYYAYMDKILSEIREAGNKALEAQKKAQMVKKEYKNKICKKSVKVNFIDNDEYKKICYENEYYRELKQKIDAKLDKINEEKNRKRIELQKQRYQQKMIQMRKQELYLREQARRRAQEERNSQNLVNAINQFNNNMNQMNQTQQLQILNNTLFLMNH